MAVSLFLILNLSIGVSANRSYDMQEADACITIGERLSVKAKALCAILIPKAFIARRCI